MRRSRAALAVLIALCACTAYLALVKHEEAPAGGLAIRVAIMYEDFHSPPEGFRGH